MSISELKESIQQKILLANDEELLIAIDTILDRSRSVFVVPKHHQKEIEKSLKEIESGNFHTLEDFEKKYSIND